VRRFPRDAVLRAAKRMDFSSLREVDAGQYTVSEEKMIDIQELMNAPTNVTITRQGRVAFRAGVPVLDESYFRDVEDGAPIIPSCMAGRRVRITFTFLPDEKS
jgi:hypothetical protein